MKSTDKLDIDISGLDKAAVLAALYNRAKQQGFGLLDPEGRLPMTVEQARVEIDANPKLYFDYLRGRVLKIDLEGDVLWPGLFDRDNGPGAAAEVIARLRP